MAVYIKHAEIRVENDYDVNVKAESEIADLKKELSEIKELLKQHLDKTKPTDQKPDNQP
jgi:uncharacterized membrane protein